MSCQKIPEAAQRPLQLEQSKQRGEARWESGQVGRTKAGRQMNKLLK